MLTTHHGDSILRMSGARDIVSWHALQAELIQSRRLPDGLIAVQHQGVDGCDYYLLEIATYPDTRVVDQVIDDMALAYLDRRVLPEVVILFLHPRGKVDAAGSASIRSRRGCTGWDVSWRAIKLWEIPASDLLETGDVGLIPCVPLARFDGRTEPIIRQCRARIDRDAPPGEHENLLAVTQVLAGLRYNDPKLFQILGGRQAMIESPVLQELIAERTRETAIKDLMTVLVARFGSKAETLETELNAIGEAGQLSELLVHAATCRTLSSFRKRLAP